MCIRERNDEHTRADGKYSSHLPPLRSTAAENKKTSTQFFYPAKRIVRNCPQETLFSPQYCRIGDADTSLMYNQLLKYKGL